MSTPKSRGQNTRRPRHFKSEGHVPLSTTDLRPCDELTNVRWGETGKVNRMT